LVFVVRKRTDLRDQVIPFFEAQPLLSSKQEDFCTFASIVRSMDAGVHLTDSGLRALLEAATAMNGGGRYRRVYGSVGVSRILRDHMPNTVLDGEDMVRSAWRHAESGRNDLTPEQSRLFGGNNNVGPYPVQP
jgi:hypothetical protein